MKLSMWIFAERLKEYEPDIQIKEGKFEIEAVRLFSPDVALEKHVMYIGRIKDLFVNGDDRILCAHNNDLIRLDTKDLESVLNNVLDTIAKYASWDNKILTLLASGGGLSQLCDASQEVLKMPILILGSTQRHLAHTSNYGIGEVDERWDQMLKEGSCDFEYLIDLNKKDPKRILRKGIYTDDRYGFPHKSYHYNYEVDGRFVGSSTYILLEDSVSQFQLDNYQLFCNYIQKWFEIHIQEQENIILESQIRQAIKEESYDCAELRRRLMLLGWEKGHCLRFYKLSSASQPYNVNNFLIQSLCSKLEDVIALPNDLSIVLLVNESKGDVQAVERHLQDWLLSSNYYGIYGLEFTMDQSFYEEYRFVKVTDEQVDKKAGQIYQGEEYSLTYLFDQMGKTIVPKALHPWLEILREYDKVHHGDLYRTLYEYLKCNKNIANTAKQLHLHRNTFLYRLEKIKELLGSDLNDYEVNLHLLISFEIQKNKLSAK